MLGRQASALRSRFAAGFRELLGGLQIELGAGVQLALDEFGELRVRGAHADGATIDHALATAPELASLFHELAAITRTLEGAEAGAAAFAPGERFVLTVTPLSAEGTWLANGPISG